MKYFFQTLPKNIIHSFAGKNIFFHILAIVVTFLILQSGLDWNYFLAVRNPTLNQTFFPAIVIGGLLPIMLPLIYIILGKIFKNTQYSVIGWTLAQAALIGSFISSVYKAFTGRVQPNLADLVNNTSHSFNFGFLEHGVFWGWPSSHTTIAFAMAFALIALFPKSKLTVFFCVLYAFYIGIGISFAIHWFSEFVAGALIGTAIGITVGRSFKNRFIAR